MITPPNCSPPRPDLPAAARLMEAARTYRMAARQLRRANPPRRAESQQAGVEVAGDGRLLVLEVLETRPASGATLAAHLTELYRAATASGASSAPAGVVVSDVEHDPVVPPSLGAGTRRFHFPPGIDDQASPEAVMAQLGQRFARRWASAEHVAQRTAELVGTGSYEAIITVRLQAHGVLESLTLKAEAAAMPTPALNRALAEALVAAQDDLRDRIDDVIEGHQP